MSAPLDPAAAAAPQPLRLPSDRDRTGRDLGEAELALLREVLESGHLNSTGGTMVPRFESAFAGRLGRRHARACASGSAACHAAVAALRLQPGDEVVTTPITDMGALVGIAYERGVPVFADVDPDTANVTARTLESCIGPRTRALVVTHLFGRMVHMQPVLELAEKHGLVVIEDAAQAFEALDADGQRAGAAGPAKSHIACFSFQQGKHMTCGEGGIVVTDDDVLADGLDRYVNKGWGYGDAHPDHDRPGLNYRMTELQAAVLCAQLDKLDGVVARRRDTAGRLRDRLAGVEGLELPCAPAPRGAHSWWRFALRVDPDRIEGGPDGLARRLRDFGIGSAPRYVRKPAFACGLFVDASAHAVTAHLAGHSECWRAAADGRSSHPGVHRALERLLVLPWNEHYTDEHVDRLAAAIRSACGELARPAACAAGAATTAAPGVPARDAGAGSS